MTIIGTRLDLDSDHENYEIETELDGETFRISVFWDERTDGWYMSLAQSDGTSVASGRRITVSNLLFGHLSSQSRPAGQLMAIDTEDTDLDPGRYDLGQRVQVIYFSAAEVAEAVATANATAAGAV